LDKNTVPSQQQQIEAFQGELAPYDVTTGTIKFPLAEPLPLELITRIVKYRVQEQLQD
jgi:uncharacterized protein YdhG (YjbR/CyaY superfamily)